MSIDRKVNKGQSFDFLPIAAERLQNNYQQDFLCGRTIPWKLIYKSFGSWFSFDKSKTRKCLKSLTERYDFLELNCMGLKVLKKNKRELVYGSDDHG